MGVAVIELNVLDEVGQYFFAATEADLKALLECRRPSEADDHLCRNCELASISSASEVDISLNGDTDIAFGGGEVPESEWKSEFDEFKDSVRAFLEGHAGQTAKIAGH